MQNMKNVFKNKNILVTGGAGFIGSSLAIELVKLGANVTVLDNLVPYQGGNLFNLEPVKNKVEIDFSDIRDDAAVKRLVRGKDYIFHLARQTDHILSITNPFVDIDVNVRGTTVLLEAIRYVAPNAKFIYTGTRGQYGQAVKLPVSEDAPTNPKGIYEITNLAAEKIIQVYHDTHHLQSVMLRLTNIYGPRSQMKHDHYGVVNWFVRLAIDNQTIKVFGDGKLKRDFLYIDDAIKAILLCASIEDCYGEIINIGDNVGVSFLDLVRTILKTAKSGAMEHTSFTKERAAQEPGDFWSDITKIHKLTGWKPETDLQSGLTKTIKYYRKYQKFYW